MQEYEFSTTTNSVDKGLVFSNVGSSFAGGSGTP